VITGGSVSVTFKKPTTAGNLIVAYVVWDNAGSVSVTDSAGDTFASAIGPTQATGDPSSAQIFYAANIAGGPDTVTASFATGISARGVLYVHEYAGLDRSVPLEGAVAASGSPLTMDSGVLTTAGAGARNTGRCSAAPPASSTATTTPGRSAAAGRTIWIRPDRSRWAT
jgi:hypothetical protein